jgi:hypothetical protein
LVAGYDRIRLLSGCQITDHGCFDVDTWLGHRIFPCLYIEEDITVSAPLGFVIRELRQPGRVLAPNLPRRILWPIR